MFVHSFALYVGVGVAKGIPIHEIMARQMQNPLSADAHFSGSEKGVFWKGVFSEESIF